VALGSLRLEAEGGGLEARAPSPKAAGWKPALLGDFANHSRAARCASE
jgi:hypothetical protein